MASQAEELLSVMSDEGEQPSGEERTLSAAEVEECYRLQVLARTFDEKAVNLHRQGRIGTYAPLRGQEAAQVGAAAALTPEDYCFPTYRDHAIYLSRGIDLANVVRHLHGRGNYVDREDPETLRTFPPTIPIATQLPHAVGAGMAASYRGDERAMLASFGDGATSEGDFHEAMNFAGVFDAPVVFFCQNNGYAISVPTERQTASETIAQKAEAYGFEGVRVDGNDVLAVHEAVDEALDRARDGGGPTLVEAVTYRRGAHTTTDDPSVYRDDEEVERWRDRDPLDRTRSFLESTQGWTEDDENAVQERADRIVAEAVATAEADDDADPDDMFEHVYATTPERFERRRGAVLDESAVDR